MAIVIGAIIVIFAAFGVVYLVHQVEQTYTGKIGDMEKEIEKLNQRVVGLEDAKKSRNPYLTNVGLEDAIALALDLEKTVEYAGLRNRYLKDILRKIRTDPGRYDEDAPNSKRDFGGL